MASVVERLGHHADDFVRLAVDPNSAANDVRTKCEAVAPGTLTQDDNAVAAGRVISTAKIAAELRLGAKQGEEGGGIASSVGHFGGMAGLRKARIADGIRGHVAIALLRVLKIEK